MDTRRDAAMGHLRAALATASVLEGMASERGEAQGAALAESTRLHLEEVARLLTGQE